MPLISALLFIFSLVFLSSAASLERQEEPEEVRSQSLESDNLDDVEEEEEIGKKSR